MFSFRIIRALPKTCVAGAAAGLFAVLALTAQAATPGLSSYPSALRQGTAGQRSALILVPAAPTMTPRWAVAHADEEAYRKRLQELGFDVSVIGPSDRPELDRLVRDSAARLPTGADVAVFVLGSSVSDGDDIRIVPTDAPADLTDRPERLEAETIRLGEVLRRVAARSPHSLVAIVDECAGVTSQDAACAVASAASLSGASIIAARRRSAGFGGAPLVARSSLRDDLLPLISQDGLTFADLHASLAQKLARTNLALDATPTLSGVFAFVPAGLFARLPTDCNKVDLNADPVALRTANLDTLQRSCDQAVAQYPYARHFLDRQSAVKEQRAFQRAVASCSDTVAISGFGSAYPASRFRRVVDDYSLACGREREDVRLQREAQERERAARDAREQDRLQREAQERDRLQREAQERDRQQREAQERDRAQREAQARATQNSEAAQRVFQQLAQTFVSRYYWTSSSDGESSGARLGELYAPVVNFYGHQRTNADIINEKVTYNMRWPTRRFLVQPGAVTACDQSAGTCRISGRVEWDFESLARNARSRGLSSFEFVVGNMTANPRIVSEFSKVETRF